MRIHHKPVAFVVLYAMLCFGRVVSGQEMDVPRDKSTTPETRLPQNRSRTKTMLINIVGAVLEVLCIETGRCTPTSNPGTAAPEPVPQGFDRMEAEGVPRLTRAPALTQETTGPTPARHLNFSFTIPAGWQRYDDISSVTLARPTEYLNGNLVNGVILGLYDVSTTTFEKGAAKYVSDLISGNKYLKRVAPAENNVVDGIPCMINRLAGHSPKSGYDEEVFVYACKRSASKIFYLVTVNSGPNGKQYEDENNRIARGISFR